MKLLTRVSPLKNGYGLAGFIRRGTANPLTRSHFILVALGISHRSRYHVVHIERDIVVLDCHPKFTISRYGGSADFYVKYIIRESTSSDVI